jgi:RNA-directed DNA polymerase
MSPGRVQGVERAPREPEGRFHTLAHLSDVPALDRAYRRQRADAAVGVHGVTQEPYGQELEAHLPGRHARLKAQWYRPQPIRRVHIPTGQGKTRPIGRSAFEDQVVQDAGREVLEAIDEQDFLRGSDGFRPGRSTDDAVRRLDQRVHRGEVRGIREAGIVSFFDRVERTELKKMLEVRGAEGALLRLIGQCLHVGGLDGEECSEPERGTTPGAVRSPLLGNVSLHDGLDRWFASEVKPRRRGKATVIRSGDDVLIGFEQADDAQRVRAVLGKRLGLGDNERAENEKHEHTNDFE